MSLSGRRFSVLEFRLCKHVYTLIGAMLLSLALLWNLPAVSNNDFSIAVFPRFIEVVAESKRCIL